MCARRFLMMTMVLTLIVVAGAFAIFQWGGNVLLSHAIPKGHFEAAKAGSAPDYAESANWIARPGIARDPSRWLPRGVSPATPDRAAVFFIHPTTYLHTDRWNAPLDPGGDSEFRTRLFVQSQASAFNGAGEVWAPRYRQAAYGAFLLKSDDAQKALDLAYSDVAAAFDRFLAEAGDRPIILAGHSQGALHLERLLKEKIAGQPVAKRIVAAYVVGWPISTRSDLPALGLPPCRTPNEAHCILSWMSFGDPANPELIFHQWEKSKGLNGGERRQKDALCVNPIAGVEGGAAPAQANPGTLVPSADLLSGQLVAGQVGAHCDKGVLILDGTIPPLGNFVLPGNNYHVYDYALFWDAVREDSERRLLAWHP
jgi:hypothetical protein